MLATRGAAGKSYVQLCEQSRAPLNSTRKQGLTNSKRTQTAHGEDINSTAGRSIAFDGFLRFRLINWMITLLIKHFFVSLLLV